jgi:hypothetical protein
MRWLIFFAAAAAVVYVMGDSIIHRLARAIAANEGFGLPGTIPTEYNNPGDLTNWPGYPVGSRGQGNITIFPDVATGWAKLYEDLANHIALHPLETLADFGVRYSGDPTYGDRLAAQLGVSPAATLGSLA